MRNLMKTSLALLTLIPLAAFAHEVRSPFPGTVTALKYYPSSGNYHGAVDIGSGGSCNYWGAETGVVGSVSWNVTIRTTGVVCYGSGSGNQNEAKHVWADGWTFRQWHFIKTADSYDRTCDRCQVGNIGGTGNASGPHAHLQQDKYGTHDNSWYSNLRVGQSVNRSTTLGFLD
ncbi:MAG TPA: hypothetical protein VK447_13725 [Myxococcaceae bacterium]|nr:hypothetical protein [Myxococcaceae bacterium]